MMDAVNERGIEEITYMMASRLGKTTVIENILGYFIDYDPSPMLMILPTDLLGKRWSKLNLQPMIRDNDCLRDKVAEEKGRSGDNEIMYKAFTGGHIVIGGANAPTSLSAYSMRIVMFDEVDRFPVSAGQEGDPINLGKQRAANYLNRKYIYTSTPTTRGLSRIEELYRKSDQRKFYVPCPICKHMQILIFSEHSQFAHLSKGSLKFDRENLSWVYYECENCRKPITERYKPSMTRAGEWRKTAPEITGHAGFHESRLLSPWTTWKEFVRNFLDTHKRSDQYKTFVNTAFGETFVNSGIPELKEGSLMNRRETYTNIPNQVVFMTAGVDVQDDRLEVTLYGFAPGDEMFLIDWDVIPGSPQDPVTWTQLDGWLLKERIYENGMPSEFGKVGGILAIGVDTGDGGMSKVVNEYVAKRKKLRFFALKGASKPQKDFVIYSRNKKLRNPLVLVDTFQGKKMIYHALGLERNTEGPTPGYIHFNMRASVDFFEQLVSEVLVTKKNKQGFSYQEWSLPTGRRNEKLDCTNYALAAKSVIKPDYKAWSQMVQLKLQGFKPDRPAQRAEPVEQHQQEQPATIEKLTTPRPVRRKLHMRIKR